MKEDILKILMQNRGVDKDGDWLINADYSNLEVLADKIEKAITVKSCCKREGEQLPDTCQDYARGKTGCIMNGDCKECN